MRCVIITNFGLSLTMFAFSFITWRLISLGWNRKKNMNRSQVVLFLSWSINKNFCPKHEDLLILLASDIPFKSCFYHFIIFIIYHGHLSALKPRKVLIPFLRVSDFMFLKKLWKCLPPNHCETQLPSADLGGPKDPAPYVEEIQFYYNYCHHLLKLMYVGGSLS